MARFPAVSLAVLCCAVPLGAQGFEGSIRMVLPEVTVPEQFYVVAVQGERWQLDLRTDEDGHGVAFVSLFDRARRTQQEGSFALYRPTATSAAKLIPASVPAAAPVELRPLNKPRKIAGTECSDYAFDAAGEALQGCFTGKLGRFIALPLRKPVQVARPKEEAWSPALPEWAIALNESELFPLKVWDAKGKTRLEVKKVSAGVLPQCFFEIPPALDGRGPGSRTTTTTHQTVIVTSSKGGRISDLSGGSSTLMLIPKAPIKCQSEEAK